MFQSEFLKNSATLLTSNVAAQIISIAVYPLITRIYSPDIFGEFTLFLSIVSVLAIFSTGRYEAAIVLPEYEQVSAALFRLCLSVNISLFVILQPVSIIFRDNIAALFDSESLRIWLPAVPLPVFLIGLWQAFNYFFTKQKKFKLIGIYNISLSFTNALLKYTLGIMKFLQSGLFLATISAQFTSLIISIFAYRKYLKKLLTVKKSLILYAAKKYNNFPKYQLPHALLNSLSGNLPILLLSVYFDKDAIGLFSLAIGISFRPINMFSNSVYQTLYREISESVNQKKQISRLLKKFISKVLLLFSPVFVVIFFLAEWLFGTLFGVEWAGAGEFLKPMLPWLLFVVITASLSFIPNIFEKQKTAMIIEITYILLRLSGLLVGIFFRSFYVSVVCYAGISVIVLAGQLIWFYTLAKKYDQSLEV